MLQSDFDIVNFHILHRMFLEPNLILGELTERFEWRPKNIYLPRGLWILKDLYSLGLFKRIKSMLKPSYLIIRQLLNHQQHFYKNGTSTTHYKNGISV